MHNEWLFIGLILIIAPIVPLAATVIPDIIGPRKPGQIKSQTYECGVETVGETWIQFKVQ
ncbi:MAG: NAD(P)H-quinone oxidoreductase subunit 3, partial [Chloroflexi bacterium]|nr:NAD(P)H-quinone oxidoreductase subunit 3 [Chloroflexota bacterium]